MLLHLIMEPRQSAENRIEKQSDGPDLQTASLFLILALLTGLFVLGIKWALLTPNLPNPALNIQNIESAGK